LAPSLAEVTSTIPAPLSVATHFPKISAIPEQPRRKLASRSVTSSRSRREPEVLVPKGELLAVAQFYEAVHRTPVDDSEQLYAAQQELQKPVELKPIEITLLEPLAKPVADSDNGPGLF
jgi:hypothetical protein